MVFKLLPKVPIAEQIINQIIEYINNGILMPNEKMPSVRELAIMASVNPNTCVKVYSALEDKGYIYSLPKKGFYVGDVKNDSEEKTKIHKMLTELKEKGVSKNELLSILEEVYNA